MTKFKTIILAVCLTISATLCLAHHVNHQKEDGVPITISKSTNFGGVDRSSTISASINGHNLSVSFTENIGDVDIEIENVEGIVIEYDYTETPSGYLCYIPLAGRYIVSFTLSNGDKYIGEFEVTD